MSGWLTWLPDASVEWASCLWRATWQGSLGLAVVWLICRLVPTMPARYQCWLWRLALVKFAIVLVWATPIGLPLLPVAAVPDETEGRVAAVSPAEREFADDASGQYAAMGEPAGPAVSSQPTGLGPAGEGEVPPTRSRIRENSGAVLLGRSVTTSATAESVATSATGASLLPALLTGLLITWLVGIVWQTTIFFRGWLGVRRLRRACRPVQNEELTESLHTLCKEFGLRRPPVLLERQGGGSAFLLSVLRPAIVVPCELRTLLGPEELRMALAHELAHVNRRDLAWSAVAAMIRVLFFFHPLVWWASRRLELAQEIAADQLALHRFPCELARYAEALLTVVNQPQPNSVLPGLAAGAASHYQTLRRRIIAMKSFHQTPRRVIIASAALLCVVATVGIVPWRLVAAEAAEPVADKPPAKSEPVKLTPAQEKIFQALQQPARFKFLEKPLERIVATIKDEYKLDLQLDEEALRDAGIKSTAPVTFHVTSDGPPINLNNALWLMFRELALVHVIRGDTLLITTPQQAKQILKDGGIDPDGVKLWLGNSKVFGALADQTTLEFIETPLQDVIDFLQDLHSIRIRFDWHALDKDAAGADSLVTRNLKGISLNSALRLMLDEFGLTQVVSHGVLLITTPTERDRLVQQGGFEPDDVRLSPANKWILPPLAEKSTLEFIKCPLQDVVDYLQELHSIEVQFDRRAMRKAGIKLDAPVTRNLQGVTLHSALQKILGKLGLAYVIQHEVLLITTPEESQRRLKAGALALTDVEPAESISVSAALKKPVTVECREKPFHEVVGVLKQQAGVEIRIDDWELATVGLSRKFPCTITARNVSLESVLNQLLRDVQLGYFVENGMIVVTGREAVVRRRNRPPDTVEDRLSRMGARLGFEGDGPARHIIRVGLYGGRLVTDDVVEELAKLKRLRELNLRGTGVTDAGLAHLADLKQLEKLDLSDTRISDAGLAHIAALENLRILSLERNITDAGLQHIQGLTRLKKLYIARAGVTDAALRYLSNMRELEELGLRDTNATGAGLEHLPAPENLRRLILIGGRVTGAALKPIGRCTQLEDLNLLAGDVTDSDLEHLRGLTQLKTLHLRSSNMSDAGLKNLAGLTQLRVLRLTEAQVTDAGLEHLAGLTRLSELNLSRTRVTGKGFSRLQMPNLKGLLLGSSKVNDEGLASMTHLTGLKTLDLSDTKVTDASAAHLRKWWQNVLALKPVDDDPFGGGGNDPFAGGDDDPFGGGGGDPFARARRSAVVVVHGTKISQAAAEKLTEECSGLRVSGTDRNSRP